METQKERENKQMHTIEEGVLFHDSTLWDLQREFYKRQGVGAWSNAGVPYFVTSNPVMGGVYAQMAAAFIEDLVKAGRETTVHIIELGAGHGRFTYYFLKYFINMAEQSSFKFPEFCYIASDFSEENIEFLENHPNLKKFSKLGILDFAVFDAEMDKSLFMRASQTTFSEKSPFQTVIVIANYVFDVLRQDLFKINGGKLRECLLTLKTATKPSKTKGNISIENLSIGYEYRDASEPAFKEDYLVEILNGYINSFKDTNLLFPTAALRCIDRLRALSPEGLMLLTADKCYNTREQLEGLSFPCFITHNRSFSLMVNYHAFHSYCKNCGGMYMSPTREHISIGIECMLFVEKPGGFRKTSAVYESVINEYGPDEFCCLLTLLEKQNGQIGFSEWLSVMRYSGYDSRTFMSFLHRLYNILPQLSYNEKRSLLEIAPKIMDMHYPFDRGEDVALELGKVLIMAGFPGEAVNYLKLSANTHDYSGETVQNLLFCYCHMKDYTSGINLLRKMAAVHDRVLADAGRGEGSV